MRDALSLGMLGILLLLPAFASEAKDEKKALEAQAKELVQQAKELERSGQLVEARKTYAASQAFWEDKDAEKAIKHIDDEIHRRIKDSLKKAHQLYDQGQFKSAIDTLEDVQRFGDSATLIPYNLALCYRKTGDSATALGYLDDAIAATPDPKRSAALKQLRTAWITGEQAAVSQTIEKDHILTINRLIDSLGFESSLEDEEPAEQASVPHSSDPKFVESSLITSPPGARTHANAKAHRTSSLCQALDGVKRTTGSTPSLTFDLANCAEDNDRPLEASQLLQHYLQMAPNSTDADRVRLRIADLDAQLKLPDEQGAQVRSLYSSASRAIEERKFDRAMANFQTAATVAPDFAPTQWRLGLMYEAMGNVDKARECLTRYKEMAADANEQAEAEIHLATLETKKNKYDEEVGEAEDIISDLLNRAMDLTFNGMEDRAALYKRLQKARKRQYDKKQLKRVGGFGVPFGYAKQELAEAGDHLSTALGLFPLGAEANELMGLVFLQANDGRSAMRSFDAVASQNLPVSFYAELRGHKKDHAVKCELTHDRLRLIFLSAYDKKGKPTPPDKPAGEDGLGDLVIEALSSRKTDFDAWTLTPAQIKHVETKNGQLLVKLDGEQITLSPIYMPAFTPTEGPAGRRFANNYTRLFVRYPGLEDSKLGKEGLTVHEKIKLGWDIANAGFSIATNLNPMGALGDVQTFMDITQELHDTAKSLHVTFGSWEKTLQDQMSCRTAKCSKRYPSSRQTLDLLRTLSSSADLWQTQVFEVRAPQPPDCEAKWYYYRRFQIPRCVMKIGFSLPNIGPIGTPEAITQIAQRAEALGYSSLWTIERLLYPVKLQAPYPATPDGSLPEAYRHVLDPLDTLTFVAAHTKKIRLGTSVLDMPYHNPVVLARRLTTIDVLSNGRLCVGLGLGWNKDEMDATGADMKKRGALADEFLPALKAIWTTNPVEFRGKFFNVPKSFIDLKPVQKPHPPIYLGAFVPAALNRVARLADGWNPILLPIPVMAQIFESLKQTAKDVGRDPDSMAMVVHAFLDLTEKPLGKERSIFCGSLDQIADDVKGCASIGANEIFFNPTFGREGQSLGRWLSLMEQLRGTMDVN